VQTLEKLNLHSIHEIFKSFVPFLQFIALVILAAIIVPLCDAGLKLFKFSQTFLCIPRFLFWAYLLFILPLIVFLFSIPMWFDSAHIVNHLPNKPKFIAHRGDPRYAPENTMASYRSAIEIEGVSVLESDVMISFDGVPFLMHDHDLKRTTNVEEIFPYRQGEDPSQFTMNELSQLEAGSHFSPSFLHEKIPTLEELLKFVVFENVSVMWDLKQPSPNHPYFSQNIQLVIDIIKRTKSASHVIWLVSTSYPGSTADSMSFVDEVAKVKSQLSGIRLAVSAKFIQKRLNPSFVRSLGMNIVNCENLISNEEIQAYKNEGLEVITYVANSESLFSQMWCLGVDMVTTERFRKFTLMTKPNWYRNKQQDIIICVLIEAQVLIVMAIQAFFYLRSNGILFFSRKKESIKILDDLDLSDETSWYPMQEMRDFE